MMKWSKVSVNPSWPWRFKDENTTDGRSIFFFGWEADSFTTPGRRETTSWEALKKSGFTAATIIFPCYFNVLFLDLLVHCFIEISLFLVKCVTSFVWSPHLGGPALRSGPTKISIFRERLRKEGFVGWGWSGSLRTVHLHVGRGCFLNCG